jgi:Flp pilus assembly protein TadB
MNPITIGLAATGGLGVFTAVYAIAAPKIHIQRAQRQAWIDGIQVRLNKAQIEMDAPEFLGQGALRGLLSGAFGALVTSNILVMIPFFIGGYLYYWAQLEDRRNQRINAYHHKLAAAMDIIVNSWAITPTLSGALQAVADYGPGAGEGSQGGPKPGSIASDFDEIWRALRTRTPLQQALQQVADRRRSPIFDGLATALLVAEEQGSQAGQMLANQANITREQVETFNEALSRQRAARSEILIGAIGAWAILGTVRLVNLISPGSAQAMDIVTFYNTPIGILVSLLSAIGTVVMYVWALHIANRGLILSRVPTEFGKEDENV